MKKTKKQEKSILLCKKKIHIAGLGIGLPPVTIHLILVIILL